MCYNYIMIKADTKEKKEVFTECNTSHSWGKRLFITTPFPLTNRIVKEAKNQLKLYISPDRDIIMDPIKIVDIYVKDISFILSSYYALDIIYSNTIIDNHKRTQFILDNCLFGFFDKKYKALYFNRIKANLSVLFVDFNLDSLFKHIYIKRIYKIMKNIKYIVGMLKGSISMKFDIVIGNPPFQPKNSGGGGLGGNQEKLYVKFVLLSQAILRDESSILSLIHPGNWRCGMVRITNKIGNYLKERIVYLDINTSKRYFGEGSSFDWYIMKNSKNLNNMIINTVDGIAEIEQDKYKIIPNIMNEHISDILNKVLYNDGEKNPLLGTDERIKGESDEKTDEFSYPLIQAGEKNKGKVWYGNRKHPLQDDIKVFISAIADGGVIHVGKDYGKAGIWQNSYITCDTTEEADIYYEFFNSQLFRFIVKINSFNRFFNYALNCYIPKIDIGRLKSVGYDFYKYFGIEEHRDYIEGYKVESKKRNKR